MRVLIVEDEFISRTLLAEMLQPYGTCHTVENGREALEEIVRSHEQDMQYDLVCLDIMMPEMDGQEVLQEIRRIEHENEQGRQQPSKVFMTTALSDIDNIMQAFTQGRCEAYITKPIRREKLIAHLRENQLAD